MAKKISLLDCTLRDGGYVNNWNFGNRTLTSVFNRLNESGVEIIEVGFLDERQPFNIDRTIQPDAKGLSSAFSKTSEKKSMVLAMIDYGTCGIDYVQPKDETRIDGIRLIFKKENMHNAVAFGKKIMSKGYKLFLQMVSITSYDDKDVVEFCEAVNAIKPYGVAIVDTYGLMHKEQMFHYFEMLDKRLDGSIAVGYHSHNNFQLAYSNTIEMLNLKTERDLIVDGTLYGMGKSAGNAPTELLAMHLNDNYGKGYDVGLILEAIDADILPIYKKYYWGYGLHFYISSKNECHPTYVEYLSNKKTLSIKAIDTILGKISPEHKLKFNKEHIEGLYRNYLLGTVSDAAQIKALSNELKGKKVLLIGTGASVSEDIKRIKAYITKERPAVMSVNFIPEGIKVDYIFIRSAKRYGLMPNIDPKIKTIATSNITPIGEPFDYVIGYDRLITETGEMLDNTLEIILNLLKTFGVDSVSLAGFDGFKEDMRANYVDKTFDLHSDFEYLLKLNETHAEKIKEFRKEMKIEFLTRSLYEG